jgi:argininosuccinate lyase
LFIFRDPLKTWDSWKRFNFANGNLALFKAAYRHTAAMVKKCKELNSKTAVLTLERLQTYPRAITQKLCERMGLPFEESMLDWKRPFLKNPNLWVHPQEVQDSELVGNHRTIASSSGIHTLMGNQRPHYSAAEASEIQAELMPIYEEMARQAEADFPLAEDTAEKQT